MREIPVQSLGWKDPLEKEMATHSSILAWEMPETEESGRQESRDRGVWQARESDITTKQQKTYT